MNHLVEWSSGDHPTMKIFTSSQHSGLVNLNGLFRVLCRNFYTTAYQEKLQNHLYRCLTFYCVNSKEYIMLSPNVLYQRLLFELYNNRKIVCRVFCMMAYRRVPNTIVSRQFRSPDRNCEPNVLMIVFGTRSKYNHRSSISVA